MNKLLFIFLILFSISACKKASKCELAICNYGTCDENTGACICTGGYTGTNCNVPPAYCVSHHTGTVLVSTSRTDEYDIYINNSYVGTKTYGTTSYSNVPSGSITVRELQVHFTFFQNDFSQAGTLVDCGTSNANY